MSVNYYHIKCKNITLAVNPKVKINCGDLRFIFSSLKDSPLKGRKNLKEFSFLMKNYVLREYHHGGILRNVLKNKYWSKNPRAFREILILLKLNEKGINVPEPLFAGKTQDFFYTQFIATEKIENARDLSEVDLNNKVVEGVFKSMEKLFDTGLYHPDMNIKNILLKEGEVYFIDFDKAFFYAKSLPEEKRYKIYKRLFRSFHKMGKLQFFLEYKFENTPPYIQKAFKDYLKVSSIRSFLWIFNKK
ncbi:3-deoxy-D-manno-octulosonic acid kinase [Thermotomaculum hydrothermale]|uniref:3-deoxy-D-manno-octulosonic acid kinase n=1 Tax=Thermotomaculum hydrothermale TaxID=981385 RepID=A0A7R6PN75_9BACT|nr:lipopolysaccharide kinase InaA family protein [Thermotomaculum hydrothermale]BBB32181.1 3-deoxy-D-manno-octulosonic acid kinase [Thermotomaculum hydrothermale]